MPESLYAHTYAMRPLFANDITTYHNLPTYDLHMWISPEQGNLVGSEQIVFPNTTGVPLYTIVLRLYPNFPKDVFGRGGNVHMEITSTQVEGKTVVSTYAAQQTALQIPLPQALLPGQSTTLDITFSATVKAWDDGNWPLIGYYPMLAVYDESGWRMDVTSFADKIYAESALYAAEITVPTHLSVAATGSTVDTYVHGNGTTTYTIYSGPSRDFALTVGLFDVVSRKASMRYGLDNSVDINVYTDRGSSLYAHQIAHMAVETLEFYEERFGAYPYRELDIHLMPWRYDGGDEHPGLILLFSDAQVDDGTRYVAAHEIAHQWWYSVVGNDVYYMPWLDEALAQYSSIIYTKDIENSRVAQSNWEREVLQRYYQSQAYGDMPIGLSVYAYPNFNTYYQTVYGKGAFFLDTLRTRIGDRAFFAGLQTYYQRHRYGVATTYDLQQAFEEASGQSLDDLFRLWVTG